MEVSSIDGVISHFEDAKAASMESSRRQLVNAVQERPSMTPEEREEVAARILSEMAANNDAIEEQKQKQLAQVSGLWSRNAKAGMINNNNNSNNINHNSNHNNNNINISDGSRVQQ